MKTNKQFISFTEARKIDEQKIAQITSQEGAWSLTATTPEGENRTYQAGSDIKLDGFAGSAEVVVVLNEEGKPIYDKLLYTQKPGVSIVVWGKDETGVVKLGYLTQTRPFAYDPEMPKVTSLNFGQIPMGFFSSADKNISLREGIMNAARRELQEEMGITNERILSIEIPTPTTCWQDPTFITNGTYVAFVRVELGEAVSIASNDHGDGEMIKQVEFLPVSEVLARIAQGKTADGVIHNMGLSLAPLMMFFARHPELFLFDF